MGFLPLIERSGLELSSELMLRGGRLKTNPKQEKYMGEEIALGQREIEVVEGGELVNFSPEELALLESSQVSPQELVEFVRTSGKQTINAALGGVVTAKAGAGQERNEPFTPSESKQD